MQIWFHIAGGHSQGKKSHPLRTCLTSLIHTSHLLLHTYRDVLRVSHESPGCATWSNLSADIRPSDITEALRSELRPHSATLFIVLFFIVLYKILAYLIVTHLNPVLLYLSGDIQIWLQFLKCPLQTGCKAPETTYTPIQKPDFTS